MVMQMNVNLKAVPMVNLTVVLASVFMPHGHVTVMSSALSEAYKRQVL